MSSETWATTEKPKQAALAAADSIAALAAQHTWLVAENSTLREQLARVVEALRWAVEWIEQSDEAPIAGDGEGWDRLEAARAALRGQ